MKVLVAFHSAGIWMEIFNELSKNVELLVFAPSRFWDDTQKKFIFLTNSFEGYSVGGQMRGYLIFTGDFWRPDRNFFGPYLTNFLSVILYFKPDIIHVINEVYSYDLLQAIIYRNIFLRNAKVLAFHGDLMVRFRKFSEIMGFSGFKEIIDIRKMDIRKMIDIKKHFKVMKKVMKEVILRGQMKFVNNYLDGVALRNRKSLEVLDRLGIVKPKREILWWPVDTSTFFNKVEGSKIREKFGIKDKFVLGYVGRITKKKGIELIFYAMHDIPGTSAIIVGDGPDTQFYRDFVSSLNISHRVFFVGAMEKNDIPRYMSAMDVLILPSRATKDWIEDFGRVLVEAMAVGIPVIGSSSGSIPDVIGDAGIVFEEGRYEKLKEAIESLMKDKNLRHILVKKGFERVRYFSTENFVKRLVDFYQSFF